MPAHWAVLPAMIAGMIADMPQDTGPSASYADSADLADLAGGREALRQAAAMPGADPRTLLDAAFAELDAAAEVLTRLTEAGATEPDQKAREASTDSSA